MSDIQLPPPSNSYIPQGVPTDPGSEVATTGNTTEATSTSVVMSLSSDTLTVYNEEGSAAALAFSVNGQAVDFATPVLQPAGDYSTLNITTPSTGNKWLDTAIQVSLSLILTETARLQAENQLKEALLSRDQMVSYFALGMQAADQILEKAEKEKEQYMALAAAGFASMAIAIAGAATSIGGAVKSFKASRSGAMADSLKAQAKKQDAEVDTAAAGSTPNVPQNKKTSDELREQAADMKSIQRDYDLSSRKLSGVGEAMTRSSSSINDILQNSIKASFVLTIATNDQLKAITESMQTVTRHAQENAAQAAKDLGDTVAQLLQLAQKIQDANVQNFTINAH